MLKLPVPINNLGINPILNISIAQIRSPCQLQVPCYNELNLVFQVMIGFGNVLSHKCEVQPCVLQLYVRKMGIINWLPGCIKIYLVFTVCSYTSESETYSFVHMKYASLKDRSLVKLHSFK
jgi:hypothetical protein